MHRASGVLMHISSLPNTFGIGSFGQSAYDFVDFLVETGQTYWQILPLGTTSYGDSPYQSFSAFAGNTHFIDFDLLKEDGLLLEDEYQDINFGDDSTTVDYGRIFELRRPILERAVNRFLNKKISKDYTTFLEQEAEWLEPFCEYMTIKEAFNLKSWHEWDDDVRFRQLEAIERYTTLYADRMNYHRVTQYLFFKQWLNLKQYANDHHIQIIGDMPIYVSEDSVEMWITPHYFKTTPDLKPTVVAGCPPDAFSEDGQLWGNPVYNWTYIKKDGYRWWIKRIEESLKLYDVVRIDHFRGFESYWEIPYGDETARNGEWVKGPDIALFDAVKEALGDVNIIAEDLGFITDEVKAMKAATGFPGMKLLQCGFDLKDSTELPHHYTQNSICYVGTHDNETGTGWYQDSASPEVQQQCDTYLHRMPYEPIADAMNRCIASSVSDTAIYTMQDLLNLNNTARMNLPSTLGGNWQWRMRSDAITPDVKAKLLSWTSTYFRLNEHYQNKN